MPWHFSSPESMENHKCQLTCSLKYYLRTTIWMIRVIHCLSSCSSKVNTKYNNNTVYNNLGFRSNIKTQTNNTAKYMQFILSLKHGHIQFKTHLVLMFGFILLLSQFYCYQKNKFYFVPLALCKSFYFCHCLLVHILLGYFCIFFLLNFKLPSGKKRFCSIGGLLYSISHINVEAKCVILSDLHASLILQFSPCFILPTSASASASAVGSTNTSTATPLSNHISIFFFKLVLWNFGWYLTASNRTPLKCEQLEKPHKKILHIVLQQKTVLLWFFWHSVSHFSC